MTENTPITTSNSKLLSYVLRHNPEHAGVELDAAGWVAVDALLAGLEETGVRLSRQELEQLVASASKQRFAFSEDGRRIRALQGHSREVDLGLTATEPPRRLYHGTVQRYLQSIRGQGLLKGQRQHVHLSESEAQATIVARRRGPPVILAVRALDMHGLGHQFFLAANGVWLTDQVPPQFLDLVSLP